MKKQTKLMAVLSAAAVIAVAAPEMNLTTGVETVYAQSAGWAEDAGEWRYTDSDGYYLTDSWKKRGDDWYYLDSEGYITKEERVDEYYVDANGIRVLNQWITIENDADWNMQDAPDAYFMYFGKDGRATTSKWQSIDEKYYYFNDEGHMQTGKVQIDGSTYYLGDSADGVMKTGWIELEDLSENPDSDSAWYYFESNGKMVENQVDKKIDGNYYTFKDGKMQKNWVKVDDSVSSESTSAAGYQYYDEDNGKRASGWLKIEGAPGISNEGELYTFYFKNGKPFYAEKGIQVFNVDSKKYGFNEKGEMQTGLKVANIENDEIANFYFANDGVMMTGKQTIYDEESGENQVWFFYTDGSRKGQGFHGIRDNSVFEYGLRKDADKDLRYAPVSYNEKQYLVNASGTIQKATSSSKSSAKPDLGNGFKDVKDANQKVWVVDTNGVIQ